MPMNVVFITSDQHRRDGLGCAAHAIVKTPHLDRLAERGVLFSNAYCDSPLCAPSRASYICGRHVHHHGALTHMINGKHPGIPGNPGIECSETLGSMFRKAGYATAAIGKLHVHGETRNEDLGFDQRAHRFYTYDYEDYLNSVGAEAVQAYLSDKDKDDRLKYNCARHAVALAPEAMQDSLTTATSIDFIRSRKERNFFIHIGLEKPHPPWTTQQALLDRYDPSDLSLPDNRHQWWQEEAAFPFSPARGFNRDRNEPFSDDEMRASIASYYACISEVDENIGRIMAALEEAEILDRTIVIFSADHGDNLFEHGLEQKHCFYEGAVAVPLIIAVPGLTTGTQSQQLCALVDIMPTLAELTDLSIPHDADGHSLLPALHGQVDEEAYVYSEFHEWPQWPARMLRHRQWKFIHYHNKVELLFDLENDPCEMRNLIDDAKHRDLAEKLRAQVLTGWSVPAMTNSSSG